MKIDTNDKQEIAEPIKDSVQFPALTIDWDLYGHYLENSDLSDDQKREFIETLWSIVVGFVDLGFGIHPLQRSCGQNDEMPILDCADVVGLIDQQPKNAFVTAASHPNETLAEIIEESAKP